MYSTGMTTINILASTRDGEFESHDTVLDVPLHLLLLLPNRSRMLSIDDTPLIIDFKTVASCQ